LGVSRFIVFGFLLFFLHTIRALTDGAGKMNLGSEFWNQFFDWQEASKRVCPLPIDRSPAFVSLKQALWGIFIRGALVDQAGGLSLVGKY